MILELILLGLAFGGGNLWGRFKQSSKSKSPALY